MSRRGSSGGVGCLVVLLLALLGSCLPDSAGTAPVVPPVIAASVTPTTANPPAPEPSPTAPATPALSRTPTPMPTPAPASSGAALRALLRLAVKGRASKTGYDRAQFGRAWLDVDHNGCDTRNDVLQRDFTHVVTNAGGCKVIGGQWTDPYSGVHYVFDHQPSELDGDHVVALSDAWQKGAQRWSQGRRIQFANDPLNVVMTVASLNRQKGDGDAATWLPPDKSFRCRYVARQIAVKAKYGLWVTAAERAAMRKVLTTRACAGTGLPSASARVA